MMTTMRIPMFVIILQDADAVVVFDTADDNADTADADIGGNAIH